ncbi:PREDICTED: CASP-like protein 4C1 isoform X2 [Tarenaya hassleriana]|uniref:CASP-like protein 4C1 isoform X2 n=1 Tax=Tarenaya hassleriana TaxID=28532 RepID=UPI0008FD2BC2|nr:PREDICTED: CASP-like protein 4C1 isoform X2 [Tarenaya hassleriana]
MTEKSNLRFDENLWGKCLFTFYIRFFSSGFGLFGCQENVGPPMRFVLVANAIVAVYSVFELGASVWEISRETTVWPEAFQVWFDFGHDQAFTYMLLAGGSGAAGVARTMRGSETCAENAAFCTQTYISLGLGFASFLFLAFSSCLSGFRVASFLITGSRFHV